MTGDGDSVEYRSDIREAFEELAERDGAEEDFGTVVLNGEVLLELEEAGLSFDTGRVEGRVRVSTERISGTLWCEEVQLERAHVILKGKGGNSLRFFVGT